MKFSLSSSIIALLAVVAPAITTPVPAPEGTQVGPLPIEELRAAVAEMKLNERDLGKRVSEGVYMCDGADFSGSCYWGSYPISVAIYPDPYWQTRIVSVGPDQGGWCQFYNGDCMNAESVLLYYPGGNLGPGIAQNLRCFYCNPV